MKLSTPRLSALRQRMAALGSSKLIHVLALCIVLLLPEMLMNLFDVQNTDESITVYIKTVVFLLVFYVEYYWVVPRSVLHGRYRMGRFFAISAVVLVISLVVLYLLGVIYEPWPSLTFVLGNLVMIVLVMSLAVAVRVTGQLRLLADKRHESEMLQRELELSRIRSQINPHLLFNTLNTIYAMVQISPDDAQKAIHQLSRILRYSLYNTSNLVPLHRELEFIEIYCSLMKMRMGGRMNLDISIDVGNMAETEVAPMLLINAVENAMKYGITAPNEPIEIHLRAADGVGSGEISNGYDPNERRRSEGARIGLKNMLRRLDLLYGDRYSLDISDTGHRYEIRFTIDLSQPPAYS